VFYQIKPVFWRTGLNTLVGMLISGRVPSSKIGDIVSILQNGMQINKSASQIKKDLRDLNNRLRDILRAPVKTGKV